MASTSDAATSHRRALEFAHVNGVRIAYEVTGDSDVPLVVVHGAWGTLGNWDQVVPELARWFRVVAYDRRGHSASERPPGQGSYWQDVDDLAALIDHLGLGPAWVIGLSSGAFITLMLAASRPELVRGIIVHEPPWWSVLDESSPEAAALDAMTPLLAEIVQRITAGDHAGAAEQFASELLGPGGWTDMPEDVRDGMVDNAPTVPDELNDPAPWSTDERVLARHRGPLLLTSGEQSPPVVTAVVHRLAECCRRLNMSCVPGQATSPT